MNILIFDTETSGHHIEYVNHILEYLIANKQKTRNNYFILVNEDAVEKENKELLKQTRNISLLYFEFQSLWTNDKKGKVKFNQEKALTVLEDYITKHHIDHCVLLNLNQVQNILKQKKVNCEISGILFNPTKKITKVRNIITLLKTIRKHMLLKSIINEQQVNSIFILNDKSKINYLNKILSTNVFSYLEDPIHEKKGDNDFDLREKYRIHPDKKIHLIIGSIRKDKGVIESIDSLKYVSTKIKKNTVLLIVGKVKGLNVALLEKKVNLENNVILDTSFIPAELFSEYIKQSDFILLPYKNPEASSGILGHAISNNKPVIIVQKGLLYQTVLKEWYGIFIKKATPKRIALAIESAYQTTFNVVPNLKYVDEHSPENFARKLLDH